MSETSVGASSVRPQEAAHFGAMAGDWWDPDGTSAMLHRLNPVRLRYIRERIDAHWRGDPADRMPLQGKAALDVGCGAGLLTEPLARLGARVTGIDAAPALIAAAKEHASEAVLAIDYRATSVEALDEQFDLVTALEVIEHVADPAAFVCSLAERLKPGGLLILSTPNATGWSRLLTITLAEGFGRIPRGTHRFDQFIAPERMTSLLSAAGLRVADLRGIAWSPLRGLHLSDDLRLNYLVAAVHAG